ncbi:interferon-related developmental regulator 2 isoform X2 [Folsomia candida]|uniref:interferon-related developmental regulator 2 isoform X2 n=1 Tax=Folsomia candida TaxID=158441 RepID=UPI000B90922B|nr:interferon-related developmental regulator 2 isoform X2 [Folsomia candida]
MGQEKRKLRVERNTEGGPKGKRSGLSDEDSVGDTASVVSLNSDRGSYDDGIDNGNDDYEDSTTTSRDVTTFGETLEDKFVEALDQITEKSANVRTTALNLLVTQLSQNFRPDLMLGRRETLRDNLERILKRGAPNEQALAAQVYSLSAIQVGALDPDLATEDFTAIKPCLQSLMLDHTASISVRAKCCEALCIGGLLAETCLQDVANLITLLEPLFGAKGEKLVNNKDVEKLVEKSDAFGIGASPAKSVKIPKASTSVLAATAISGWSLLLTIMSPDYLSTRVHRWTGILQGLLDHPDLEMRLCAGEALAILVEMCELTEDSEDTYSESEETDEDDISKMRNGHSNKKTNMKVLIEKLRELSVESHKYRAKKDRRQQHHSFRDYLHAVEDGDGPGFVMRFGSGEVLEIESWAKKRQYDAICKVLGSGINRHLVENMMIRQVLELGSPKPAVVNSPNSDARQAKSDRQYLNAMNFKVRSVNRGKNRDHRMATLEDY